MRVLHQRAHVAEGESLAGMPRSIAGHFRRMVGDHHAGKILVAQNADDLGHVDVAIVDEGLVIFRHLAAHVAEMDVADALAAGEAADMLVDVFGSRHLLQRAEAKLQPVRW